MDKIDIKILRENNVCNRFNVVFEEKNIFIYGLCQGING